MKPSIDLLCRLRCEVRDWQEALSGEREGLDELCAEIDAHIENLAAIDGYRCNKCKSATIPHDSDHCSACGAGGVLASG
jgi:hypothetical protein